MHTLSTSCRAWFRGRARGNFTIYSDLMLCFLPAPSIKFDLMLGFLPGPSIQFDLMLGFLPGVLYLL